MASPRVERFGPAELATVLPRPVGTHRSSEAVGPLEPFVPGVKVLLRDLEQQAAEDKAVLWEVIKRRRTIAEAEHWPMVSGRPRLAQHGDDSVAVSSPPHGGPLLPTEAATIGGLTRPGPPLFDGPGLPEDAAPNPGRRVTRGPRRAAIFHGPGRAAASVAFTSVGW